MPTLKKSAAKAVRKPTSKAANRSGKSRKKPLAAIAITGGVRPSFDEMIADATQGGKIAPSVQEPQPVMDWLAYLPALTFEAPRSFDVSAARGALKGDSDDAVAFMFFVEDGGAIGASFWNAYADGLRSGVPNETVTRIAKHRLAHWIMCAEVSEPAGLISVRGALHPTSDYQIHETAGRAEEAAAICNQKTLNDAQRSVVEAAEMDARWNETAKESFDPFIAGLEEKRREDALDAEARAAAHDNLLLRGANASRDRGAKMVADAACFAGFLIFCGMSIAGVLIAAALQ